MKEETFELKLSSGKTVTWTGEDGEHAARRYVALHPSETVVAWRHPRYELKIGMVKIA